MRLSLKIILFGFLVSVLIQSALAIIEESSIYEKIILERGILRKGIIEKFFINFLEGLRALFEHHFKNLVEKNPDILHPSIQGVINHFIFILEPLCILGLLITGLYFILMSGTPWGRAFAKSIIPGLILAILVIPFSSFILSLLFQISELLTGELFSLSTGDPTRIFTESITFLIKEFSMLNEFSFILSLPFIFLATFVIFSTLVLFVIRYLLLTFFSIILPATIFLYFFLPTRELGKRILELSIALLFVQIIAAITLISFSGLFSLSPLPFSGELVIVIGVATSLTLLLITLFTISTFRDYLPE